MILVGSERSVAVNGSFLYDVLVEKKMFGSTWSVISSDSVSGSIRVS